MLMPGFVMCSEREKSLSQTEISWLHKHFFAVLQSNCSCNKTLCVILELRISKPLAINAVFKTQEFETENTSAFSLRMQIILQY